MDWIERLKIQAHDPERAVQNFVNSNVKDQTGKLYRPIANPPASLEMIHDFERTFTLNFPNDLRRIYLEVGNGGFGPSYGLLPISESVDITRQKFRAAQTIVEFYYCFRYEAREGYEREWSRYLLPFCSHGCDGLTVVDLRDELVGFIQHEILEKEPIDNIIEWHKTSIKSWFEAWMAGEDLSGYSKNFWKNHLDKLFLLHHPV